MTDTYRHKGLRKRLVETIRLRGLADEAVLTAIGQVPRHFFLDKAFEEHAYEDKPFAINHEQTISQPSTVAYQTTLLAIKPREKVLEIGTGSGYQAAVLAAMGARVFSVERQEGLYLQARDLLERLKLPVRCFFRDGSMGLPEFAPFDKILVTAGAPGVPEALKKQLKTGGVLVIPVGGREQFMVRLERLGEADFREEVLLACRFVPFLEGVEKV